MHWLLLAPLQVVQLEWHAAHEELLLAKWSDGQTARQAPPCRYWAYEGHAVHCVAEGPPHAVQLLSQLWQTFELSAYVPAGHDATQLLPWRFGLLETHVTQSVDAAPAHVKQSEWHVSQRPLAPWKRPSGHDEMQSFS